MNREPVQLAGALMMAVSGILVVRSGLTYNMLV